MAGRSIDLNADLGESFGAWSMGDDEAILAHVTSANVACGFHAGDPLVMDRTVARAVAAGVAIGAHPGYPDLRGFGRRPIAADPAEVEADVVYQVGALLAFVRSHGARLVHVKPHGALYNQAAVEESLARAIARAIARVSGDLVFVGAASSPAMRRAAEAAGLRFAAEAFADRAYEKDGTLVPRGRKGAVVTETREAAARAVRIACEGRIAAVDGTEIELAADTICLHGDTPGAVAHARAVRAALEAAHVAVRPLAP